MTAKFARGLIERIVLHGLERGYWQKGSVVGDPFAGVACGGIVCAYHGLQWIGCELEPVFVQRANENIALHRQRLEALGAPLPIIRCGDSRAFARIVGEALAGVVCSPPWTETGCGKSCAVALNRQVVRHRDASIRPGEAARDISYGASPGQLGAMREGTLQAALTSPPYAQGHEPGRTGNAECEARLPAADRIGSSGQGVGYGASPGQLGAMREGTLAAALTSPPYANSVNSGEGGIDWQKAGRPEREVPAGSRHGVQGASMHEMNYGQSPGQVGSMPEGDLSAVVTSPPHGCDTDRCVPHGNKRADGDGGFRNFYSDDAANIGNPHGAEGQDFYWLAVSEIYQQVMLAMRPGGHLVVVVKSFVRDGKIVDLPTDTLTLLVSLGFEPVERIRAMLTSEKRHAGLWGEQKTKTERKSFFRRLAEKRGSPAIDYEVVLVVKRAAR